MRDASPSFGMAQKAEERLFLLPRMQKGLAFLELPLPELAPLIREEIDENPLLECEESDLEEEPPLPDSFNERPCARASSGNHDLNSILENSLAYESSLFDFLMAQASERVSREKMKLAEALIGHLDGDGYLRTPIEEIALFAGCEKEDLLPVLALLQSFDPPGIAATSIQESLLIQLKRKSKEKTLAFLIVEKCLQELLSGRIGEIAKKLKKKPGVIEKCVRCELARLNWRPATSLPKGHYAEKNPLAIPDLIISLVDETLSVSVNNDKLPRIHFNHSLLREMRKEKMTKESRRFLNEKMTSGKWLLKYLFDRERTLFRIGEKLIEYQKDFFLNPKGQLHPRTMKELAHELSLHESTIVRAVADKYVATPKGLMPLRSLFTHAVENTKGEEISPNEIKDLVQEIIKSEDQSRPLSDDEISSLLHTRGYLTARRTVAKYRTLLGIPSSQHRRRYL